MSTDITITITNDVAEALLQHRDAGFDIITNPSGPGSVWVDTLSDDDVTYETTEEALRKALPRIAGDQPYIAETPDEERGRLRRELTELHHDTPEYRATLDRIAILTREAAVDRRREQREIHEQEVARRRAALRLLERMHDLETDAGARGYTKGIISRINAGETVTDSYLEQLRTGLDRLEREHRASLGAPGPERELRSDQALGENEPQPATDMSTIAADGEAAYHEQLAENRPGLGQRVKLRHDVERYPHFVAPAGATGRVVDTGDETIYAVQLDKPIAGAAEWDNMILWDLDSEEPAEDLDRDYVNRDEIARMTIEELREAILDGGPAEAIEACQEELDRKVIETLSGRNRRRLADEELDPSNPLEASLLRARRETADREFEDGAWEIYRGDWDAHGTVSVHLPASVNLGQLLENRGWEFKPNGSWRSPNGRVTFDIETALQIALVAEAL